ncbi:MAG: hypothetical protein WKG06_16000 [Segetibacter sp.]
MKIRPVRINEWSRLRESAKGDVKAEKDKAGNAIATTTEAEPDLSLAKPKETGRHGN